MARLSPHSITHLNTCDRRLQDLFLEVIKAVDFRVLEGHRDKPTQDRVFKMGTSRTQWPHSRHNTMPSQAIDVAPYPIVYYSKEATDKIRTHWKAIARWYLFAGIVQGIAGEMGIPIRWGGLWKRSETLWIWDNKFDDLGHFELVVAQDPLGTQETEKTHREG